MNSDKPIKNPKPAAYDKEQLEEDKKIKERIIKTRQTVKK